MSDVNKVKQIAYNTFREEFLKKNFMMPCRVTSVKGELVTVKMNIKYYDYFYDYGEEKKEDITEEFPEIEIPILKLPFVYQKPVKNDYGLYLNCDYELSDFLNGVEPQDADDTRNIYGNGFFLPLGYSKNNTTKLEKDLVIDARDNKMEIKNKKVNLKEIEEALNDFSKMIWDKVFEVFTDASVLMPPVTPQDGGAKLLANILTTFPQKIPDINKKSKEISQKIGELLK